MRSAHVVPLLLALLLCAATARAESPADVLDAPAPPTLPALAHLRSTFTFEYTAAGIAPSAEKASGDRAVAWFAHAELEVPLRPRTFYVGAAYDVASGAVPGLGRRLFSGSPELWARGLWSSVLGLSSGAGFGVVLPLPRDPSETEAAILQTVRVVRPWDSAYLTDRTLTLRPWFDIRHVAGRFVFQLRQGLDAAFVLRELRPLPGQEALPPELARIAPREHRMDLTARATLYLGFRAARAVGLGLEVWEVYQLTADIADDKRASFAISPSVRLLLGRVAPAFSVLFPITTPLRGEAASYFAARFNVGFDFDLGWPRADVPGGLR